MAITGQTRANTPLAVPPDKQYEVVANIYEDSALLQLADVRQMTAVTQDIITAGAFSWASGAGAANMAAQTEVSAKPESTHTLQSFTLTAQKMATFIIVSDELLSETPIDLISFYQDAITQRMAQLIDISAITSGGPFGTQDLVTGVTAQTLPAGNVATPVAANYVDAMTAAFNAIEAADYLPNGWLAARSAKGTLRGYKETGTGQPMLSENYQTDIPDQFWGEPIYFLGRGVFPTSAANTTRVIVGDFSQYVIGIRDELTFSLHSEGTINGTSLLETNQTALRAEMRLGAVRLTASAFGVVKNAAT